MSTRYVARNPEVAWRRLGDSVMLALASTSEFFSLNEHAAAIWEAADGRSTLADIVHARVLPMYEVDSETALADADSIAELLAQHGLLRISSEPIDTAGPNL